MQLRLPANFYFSLSLSLSLFCLFCHIHCFSLTISSLAFLSLSVTPSLHTFILPLKVILQCIVRCLLGQPLFALLFLFFSFFSFFRLLLTFSSFSPAPPPSSSPPPRDFSAVVLCCRKVSVEAKKFSSSLFLLLSLELSEHLTSLSSLLLSFFPYASSIYCCSLIFQLIPSNKCTPFAFRCATSLPFSLSPPPPPPPLSFSVQVNLVSFSLTKAPVTQVYTDASPSALFSRSRALLLFLHTFLSYTLSMILCISPFNFIFPPSSLFSPPLHPYHSFTLQFSEWNCTSNWNVMQPACTLAYSLETHIRRIKMHQVS